MAGAVAGGGGSGGGGGGGGGAIEHVVLVREEQAGRDAIDGVGQAEREEQAGSDPLAATLPGSVSGGGGSLAGTSEQGGFAREEQAGSDGIDDLDGGFVRTVPRAASIQAEARVLLQALHTPPAERQLLREQQHDQHRRPGVAAADKFTQQALSASVGAVLTSFLVTPFEVVKVRQQAWVGAAPSAGTLVRRLADTEGVLSLWSGLRPALLMSVPSTVLYLSAYEKARDELSAGLTLGKEWASFVAGGSARLVTSTVVSPLELLRTRMQASTADVSLGLWAMASKLVQAEGAASLWRGLVPTLWRDVPFSCLYWLTYEAIKKRAVEASPSSELSAPKAFAAGATAGTLAALATTPLDVIKTRQQLQQAAAPGVSPGYASSLGAQLLSIARQEGISALFVGLGPRVAKVAPSCAIMIASYELGKRWLGGVQLPAPPLPLKRSKESSSPCLVQYFASCESTR